MQIMNALVFPIAKGLGVGIIIEVTRLTMLHIISSRQKRKLTIIYIVFWPTIVQFLENQVPLCRLQVQQLHRFKILMFDFLI